MQQENEEVRAFDVNGEEVELSTIDLTETDSDADIGDDPLYEDDGVSEEEGSAQEMDTIPNQVTVTLPRDLLERVFARAGIDLPGTMGAAEIIEALASAFSD